MKSKEWQFHRDTLLLMKGVMLEHMFSRQFTELDAETKNVTQKAYFHISQVLDFLINPLGVIQKKSGWRNSLTNLVSKGKPSKPRKETEDGR